MASSTTSISVSNKSIFDNEELNIAAKLRRLKAEESIMYKSLIKSESKDLEENIISSYSIYSKTENNIEELKKSFNKIKNLFRDVKCRSVEESLTEIDIDDVKRDVTELDSKIITLQQYLLTELNSLKIAELEITKQIDETTSENKSIRRRSLGLKPNKDYVLSPVKSIITTPARCLEVQQFQDFMKNGNRYGGWIEYNHCIFLKLWEKYVKQHVIENCSIEEQSFFPQFLKEVLQKCHGTTKQDVVTHTKWYVQYNILKESQQKAIEKWKSNRRKIKLSQRRNIENKKEEIKSWSVLVNNIEENSTGISTNQEESNKTDTDSDHSNANVYSNDSKHKKKIILKHDVKNVIRRKNGVKLNYLKPTKQWTYRSVMYNDGVIIDQPNNLEDLQKLCIPTWRVGLE